MDKLQQSFTESLCVGKSMQQCEVIKYPLAARGGKCFAWFLAPINSSHVSNISHIFLPMHKVDFGLSDDFLVVSLTVSAG